MKVYIFMILILLVLAGCGGSSDEDGELPTALQLPSETSTPTPTYTPTPSPTLTFTATMTASPTATFTPSPTLIPTSTPTVDLTRAAEFTVTAIAQETPIFATFTPIPVGTFVPTREIPVMAADIIITEPQFQIALNTQIASSPDIENAVIDFIAGQNSGIRVRMTALGGQAFVTGDVFIAFQVSGGFLAISVVEINVGSGEPPARYVEVAEEQLQPMIVEALDSIIQQRLGELHDLETLTFTGDTMEIMLLVPAGDVP